MKPRTTKPAAAMTVGEAEHWRGQLEHIAAVARRRRLFGRPDHFLERGLAILERRLAEAQR